jgi:hypothetical protein
MNFVGLNRGESIFKGDSVFVRHFQRIADAVQSCGTPWGRAKLLTLKGKMA